MSVARDSVPSAPPSTPQSPGPRPAEAGVVAELRAAGVEARGRVLLAPVDLRVPAGETVAIVGRSGAGKTTLLHLLAGLLAPTTGTVRAGAAALMPQRDGLMAWATARDNAALPLRIAGRPRAEARQAAERELASVGLSGHARRRVARLSGGQRQRVALARTLLTGRDLLLLDEPFAAVDALTRDELHALLLEHLGAEGRSAVLVTHDVEEAVRLATTLLVLTPRGLVTPEVVPDGEPGQRLAERGGEPLRAAILRELAA